MGVKRLRCETARRSIGSGVVGIKHLEGQTSVDLKTRQFVWVHVKRFCSRGTLDSNAVRLSVDELLLDGWADFYETRHITSASSRDGLRTVSSKSDNGRRTRVRFSATVWLFP